MRKGDPLGEPTLLRPIRNHDGTVSVRATPICNCDHRHGTPGGMCICCGGALPTRTEIENAIGVLGKELARIDRGAL